MTIAWQNVRVQPVVDDVGRRFKWTDLKGKRIYICGHGAHIFRDGYCAVPPGTTVNFYQTYGRSMSSTDVYRIVDGSKNYATERSFTAGQSCPNMTLFDDIGEQSDVVKDTADALKRRLGVNLNHPDHFIFNCNQFSGLTVYKPLLPRPVLDRQTGNPLQKPPKPGKDMGRMLKLDEILTVLQGNTLEWVCCQDPTMDRYVVETGGPQTKPSMNTDGLSDRVKVGLKAMAEVSAAIAYTRVVSPSVKLGGSQGVHFEGTWAASGRIDKSTAYIDSGFAPQFQLNRARTPVKTQDMRQTAMASRLKINDGLRALEDEPQGNPFKTHQARAELRRGLLVVDNLLRNMTGQR